MSAHCLSCVSCQEQGCDHIAYCLDDQPIHRTCQHDQAICPSCWPGSCVPCRLAAEADMYETGVYSAAADPFYRTNAVDTPRTPRIEVAAGVWKQADELSDDALHRLVNRTRAAWLIAEADRRAAAREEQG